MDETSKEPLGKVLIVLGEPALAEILGMHWAAVDFPGLVYLKATPISLS
jgi:hypothetical protein